MSKKQDDAQGFAAIDETDQWHIAEGMHEGAPIIVRFNAALRPYVGQSDHSLKIGFAIPLNDPRPGQLPDPDENDQLAAVEDRIRALLLTRGGVVHALAITMGTFKEFIFYARPGIDVRSVHEQLQEEIKSHTIQCYAAREEDWGTFLDWSRE